MKTNMNLAVSICPPWIDRFLDHGGFVLRKGTRKPVLGDDEIVACGVHFVNDVRAIIARHSVQPANVYNLDETAVFFDHAKSTTVHTRGAKDVPIRSFGFEKQRVAAVFCANAVGRSCPFDNGVMELRMGTSWINSAAFIEYTKCLFPDPLVPHSTLLISDLARCHTAKDVQDYLEQRGILHAIIPGGMTEFCQPADFGWFAQLKNHLARVIDCWKRDGSHQLPRGGRMKPPSSVVVARWLTEAWNVVQPATIRTSFTRCALGADNQLHLYRHERLGTSLAQKIEANSNEQLPERIQGLLDEFEDFLIVYE